MKVDEKNQYVAITANGTVKRYGTNELFSYGGEYIFEDSLFSYDFGYHMKKGDKKKKFEVNYSHNDIYKKGRSDGVEAFKNGRLYASLSDFEKSYYDMLTDDYGNLGRAYAHFKLPSLLRLFDKKNGKNLTDRESFDFSMNPELANTSMELSYRLSVSGYSYAQADFDYYDSQTEAAGMAMGIVGRCLNLTLKLRTDVCGSGLSDAEWKIRTNN